MANMLSQPANASNALKLIWTLNLFLISRLNSTTILLPYQKGQFIFLMFMSYYFVSHKLMLFFNLLSKTWSVVYCFFLLPLSVIFINNHCRIKFCLAFLILESLLHLFFWSKFKKMQNKRKRILEQVFYKSTLLKLENQGNSQNFILFPVISCKNKSIG